MSIAYITEQGAFLTKKGDRLLIKKGNNTIQTIHSHSITQLIISGNLIISTQIIAFLLEKGIDTVFLSVYGKYRGRLSSRFSKNIDIRILQFNKFREEDFALNLSKQFVFGKLTNCLKLLRRRIIKIKDETLKKSILNIRKIINKIDVAVSLDQLRGYEGAAANSYFKAFSKMLLNNDFSFKLRSRRPPMDKTNALLSLLYTFLNNTVQSIVETSGLDPYLGVFHQADYGRPSLGLDLMEEFRPVLGDILTLNLINKKIITKKDFIIDPTAPLPFKLSKLAMKKVIMSYEKMLQSTIFIPELGKKITYFQIIKNQLYKIQNLLLNKREYKPYILRR